MATAYLLQQPAESFFRS